LSVTAPKKTAAKDIGRFRPVPMAAIRAMDSLGMNLYCLHENDTKPVLLCSERQTQTAEQLASICADNHRSLLVSQQDFSRFSQKLLELLDHVLADNSVSLEIRFSLLQIAYADEIERQFRKQSMEKYIELAQEIGPQISSLLQQGEISIQTLFNQVHRNSSHYAHVTNVAAYTVLLAKALDMVSPQELDRIAVGCLLHDVGKLYLPEEILTKKGRLSPHDHEEFNRVPLLAYEVLSDFQQVEFSQLMMIYQQNERMDGTGYPVKITAEEIHPWAKLLAVTVAFNAMTSDRAFRPASTLQEGLIQLADNVNTHFEPEMVLCWISAFQLQ